MNVLLNKYVFHTLNTERLTFVTDVLLLFTVIEEWSLLTISYQTKALKRTLTISYVDVTGVRNICGNTFVRNIKHMRNCLSEFGLVS